MSEILAPQTQATAAAFISALDDSSKWVRDYDYTRRFVAKAGTQGTEEIPMPSEGDFQSLGYNIEYDLQANGKESIFLRFHQQDGGKNWSNDLIPIRSIATPGARIANQPGIRYGYRTFGAFIRKNDKIAIDWQNTSAEDLEVIVTFTGRIWLVY
jgi:hypothetical protein